MLPQFLKDELLETAMDHFKIPKGEKKDILGKRRYAFLVEKRRLIAQKLHDMGLSYVNIGLIMNRDHTSIMSLLKQQGKKMEYKKLKEQIEKLKRG